ncbi:MAG TPA: RrF2 family transcriptional regulator [Candidatus Deferrimicrobiaceae bacterium]|jgi:Rrf2 family iron-sulfur cluster assembly transcriptional regulator
MKITTRGRYAVMALVSLAASSRGNPVALKDIAGQEEIPEPYLQQLFSRLRRRNLVKSIRGPGGGFLLARHPSQISIGEIIRTAEGRDAVIGCRRSGRTCGRIERCKTQGMWDALESRMEEFLDSISIEDLFRETPEEEAKEVGA